MLQISAKKNIKTTIALPSSKSESNRVLLLNALYEKQSNKKLDLHNISTARDTVTMQRLLASKDLEMNVLDAGTTMRFLTAFCSITRRKAILTGTDRMCERPIRVLVEALQNLGAEINYLQKDGFPPLEIQDFAQKTKHIQIRGDVSSQYISALLMLAPLLPQGLTLELLGTVHSKPYILMTLELMQHFGIESIWQENTIHIATQNYQFASYTVEADWSAASYWYSVLALAEDGEIFLEKVKEKSLQGDKAIVAIARYFGVESHFTDSGVQLSKSKTKEIPNNTIDFSHCPDLAQTIAVLAAAQGREIYMTGLQSLRIKETDRILAIQNELANFGIVSTVEKDTDLWIKSQKIQAPTQAVETYKDHRMAMAFAPLALLFPICIEEPEVVAKSYPHFWEDIQKIC